MIGAHALVPARRRPGVAAVSADADTGEEAHAVPFLKRFTVFNTGQRDGLSADIAATAPMPLPGMIEPQVEALIKATTFASAAIAPSICRQKTMCRCRRRRPISNRSIGTGPRCMSLATLTCFFEKGAF